MEAVIMPRCPYCREKYRRQENDRLERATTASAVLIRCPGCKERYYVRRQVKFTSRTKPA